MTDFPHVHFPHHGSNGPQLPGAKLLEGIFALMEHTGASFANAAHQLGVNPADIDPADFGHNFGNQSSSVQSQIMQGADALPQALRTVVDSFAAQGLPVPTPVVPGAPDVPAPAAPPPGDGLRTATPTVFADPSARMFPTASNPTRADAGSNVGTMIQALFGSAAAQRADAVLHVGTTLQTANAGSDAARPDGLQNLAAMVQRFVGGAAGADAPPPAGHVVQARADGSFANALQSQAVLEPAQRQGAQQSSGFAGQQAAIAEQPVQRTAGEAPLGAAGRSGDNAMALQRSPDAAAPVATPDRPLSAQQQLQAQAVPVAYGRPDVVPAQVVAQAAGASVLANTQAAMLPSQATIPTTVSMPPLPPGNESAAAQGRENLILPSGHTLSGNLRRDLRGGANALHRPVDWILALVPGNAKRRASPNDESATFQWVFWLLTVVTYTAIAIAIVSMLPGRGGLTSANGTPSLGAYALIIGAAAAIASWFVGRRLVRRIA